MRTIEQLIAELKNFDNDNFCYVYEGEVEGIVIINHDNIRIGFISCPEQSNNKRI